MMVVPDLITTDDSMDVDDDSDSARKNARYAEMREAEDEPSGDEYVPAAADNDKSDEEEDFDFDLDVLIKDPCSR